MNIRKKIVIGLALGAAGFARTETKTVSYAFDRIEIAGGDVVEAETPKVGATYPSGLPTPIFWLDASDRTGWSYDAQGGVTNIPDKAGSGRFLQTKPAGSDYWSAIGQAKPAPSAPTLVTDDAAFPHPYLDFGVWPNGHGLLFDSYKADAYCTSSNTLERVGSVIAVYGSQGGGGYFLMGAKTLSDGTESRDYNTLRGGCPHSWSMGSTPGDYASCIYTGNGYGGTAFSPLVFAYMWQEGMQAACQRVGFGKDWQVLSLCPTNALAAYSGLGLARFDHNDWAGGQRVAEMIFFDRVLSNADQQKVEAYLHAKWFAASRGWDGNAHVGRLRVFKNEDSMEGQVATLSVPAGEKLTIDHVQGGRGDGAALVKTGAGTVEFGDLSDYTGTLKLEGGTLSFTRKTLPTLADIPEPYFHLDASAPNALEGYVENGTNFVTVWNNVATNTIRNTYKITCARSKDWTWSGHTINTDCRYVPNALGPGLHAVDFGTYKTTWTWQNKVEGYFGAMFFADAVTNYYTLQGVTTVIAVMGAHNGGGQILGGSGSTKGWENEAFARGGGNSQDNGSWYQPLAKIYPVDLPEIQNGYKATPWKTNIVSQLWVDGERDFIGNNYRHPGYHVIAKQTSGMATSIIGGMTDGNGNMYNGGGRYCEILLYDRILSEDQILAASAYLRNKWFGGVSTGYARPSDMKVADIQYLDVTAPATIDVPAGATVKIGKLILHATLTKTGDGTLEVVESENPGAATVVVQVGSVLNGNPSDVAAKCELAESPSFHIDPNSISRVTPLWQTNYCAIVDMEPDVRRPNTMRGRSGHGYDKAGPMLDLVTTQNGNPMFDFGSAWGYNRWCTLGESLDSVRHVFFVWDTRYGGGRPFGTGRLENLRVQTASGSTTYTECNELPTDFKRTSNGKDWPLFQNSCTYFPYIEELRTNGVAIAKHNFYPDCESTYLVELKLKAGFHISVVGMQMWADNNSGALRLGEMLAYSRELTERERTATSNYLMKKWMGASEADLPDLPAVEQKEGPFIPDPYIVTGEQELTLVQDASVSEIRGAGTLTLNGGAKTFTNADLSFFTGTVAVASGTLKLTGEQPIVDLKMPTEGMTLNLDATKGVVEVSNNPGWLQSWYSTLGDGWYANGYTAYIDKEGLNGKPVVVMDRNKGEACCRFVSPTGTPMSGSTAMLEEIRSVLWVVGSDLGGGFLLGGGTNAYDEAHSQTRANFCRARHDIMEDPSQPLVNSATQKEVREADWYMNGAAVDCTTTGLSGDWDIVGMALQSDAADCTRAQGLAFSYSWTAQYYGHQKLAEVAIYDRVLSSNEIVSATAYLQRKWGIKNYTSTITNRAGVVVGEGATLDCGDYRQYLGSVGGAGTVEGDIETPCVVLDAANPGTLAVSGSCTLADGFKVMIANGASLADGEYKLLTTTDGVLGSFDKTAVEVPGVANPPHFRIRRLGNDLILRVGRRGMVMFVW